MYLFTSSYALYTQEASRQKVLVPVVVGNHPKRITSSSSVDPTFTFLDPSRSYLPSPLVYISPYPMLIKSLQLPASVRSAAPQSSALSTLTHPLLDELAVIIDDPHLLHHADSPSPGWIPHHHRRPPSPPSRWLTLSWMNSPSSSTTPISSIIQSRRPRWNRCAERPMLRSVLIGFVTAGSRLMVNGRGRGRGHRTRSMWRKDGWPGKEEGSDVTVGRSIPCNAYATYTSNIYDII